MSFERVLAGTGIGAEPPIAPTHQEVAVAVGSNGEAPPAMRLQILSTEHWSLLATRSLAWNESFTRAGMFLSTLSGSMVALALVAQASGPNPGRTFGLFALVILPVVLFVGVATFIRMAASNYYDAICVIGMNRIRAGYLELAPDLERYFVMSAHDDPRGVAITMGVEPGTRSALHMMAATPFVISTLNSVVAGAIGALIAIQLGSDTAPGLVLGAAGFGVAMAIQQRFARRSIARARAGVISHFPTPER
jgi:hypothetical protein